MKMTASGDALVRRYEARTPRSRQLWEQSQRGQGVVVTIPPSPKLRTNSIGIMALSSNLAMAYETYTQALQALGAKEDKLLFELKV